MARHFIGWLRRRAPRRSRYYHHPEPYLVEEALRVLFAGNESGVAAQMAGWLPDVRAQALMLMRGENRG